MFYQISCAIRSAIHMLWMLITVVPYALAILLAAPFASKKTLYTIAAAWLSLVVHSLRFLCGVRWHISGMENMPQEHEAPVILVKHQSTLETFLMPAILPRQLAYVYKKELNYVPFFGWEIAQLDMVHIDRRLRSRAFQKVVQEGTRIMHSGVSVIMFPEGTRIPRGQAGSYKTGGTRLAASAGSKIIPIAVTSAKCWPRKGFIKYPGLVEVSIGPAIESQGRAADELMAQVEAWIEGEMHRLDPEAYAQKS